MSEISITGGTSIEADFNFIEFTIELSAELLDAATVNYRLLRGTALDDDLDNDITSSFNNGAVTFAPGETSKIVQIEANSDTLDEFDEFFTLELYDPTDNVTFEGGTPVLRATGIILDDDGAGSNLAVFVTSPVLVEGDSGQTLAVFEVQLSQPAGSSITVDYSTADITAVAGADYVAQSGSITFETGQQVAQISVAVVGDEVAEAAEMFALVVSPASGAALATAGAVGEALILDTDTSPLPEISIAGDVVDEGDFQFLRYVVTLSEPTFDAVSVNFRTLRDTALDDDIDNAFSSAANNGTLVFAAGETSKEIFIEANTDTIDERDEAIVLELYNPSNNAVFAGGTPVLRSTGIILDDDGVGSNLAVFVSDPVVTEADGDTANAVFEITLSQPSTSPLTLSYATADISAMAGEDYVAQSGTISFAPGQTFAAVSVPVIGDAIGEGVEAFSLSVTPSDNVSIGTEGATGHATIIDTDASILPAVSIEGDVAVEGDFQFLRFVVTLSEPALDVVSVLYRTKRDTGIDSDLDNAITSSPNVGLVTFAPGETSKEIFIETNTDTLDERDESVTVELFDLSSNAVFEDDAPVLRATGIILDDDGVGSNLALFVSDPMVTESDAGQQFVVFDITLSQPAPIDFTIDYATTDITAVAGEDYIAQAGTLDFKEGQTKVAVVVPVIGDTDAELVEKFALVVTPPDTLSIGTDGAVGMATIIDTDSGTLPQISIEGGRAEENDFDFIEFIVTLSEPSLDQVTVEYSMFDGSADTSDLDNGFQISTVIFEPGETSQSIYVEANSDDADERDESFSVRLFDPVNATFSGSETEIFATGFLLDNDGLGPNIALAGETTTIAEGPTVGLTHYVEVELSQPSATELSFDVTMVEISATVGDDIILLDDTVTFAPGQTTAAVRVIVGSDNVVEGDEIAELSFAPTVDTPFAGTIPNTTITITDNLAGDGTPNGVTLTGNSLMNELFGGVGDDAIFGFLGDDLLGGGAGNDSLYGGAGADEVYGSADDDNLYGENGNDLLGGFDGNDRLDGGRDNDTLYGAGDDDTLLGGEGDDLLGGFTGDDLLFGGDGADDIYGSFDNDTLYGGDGNDLLGGFSGNDSLNGQAGADEAYGGEGDDTVRGGNGDDLLGGFTGNDLLRGGEGQDQVYGSDGFDTLFGGAGDDTLGAGIDDDVVFGGSGADEVSGGLGNDLLFGGADNDTLFGAGGDDTLNGGDGDDEMFGGPGADVVVFSTGDDVMFAFSTADDKVDLSGVISIIDFADLSANHLSDAGGSAVITDDLGNTLTLDGVAILSLSDDDFIF